MGDMTPKSWVPYGDMDRPPQLAYGEDGLKTFQGKDRVRDLPRAPATVRRSAPRLRPHSPVVVVGGEGDP
ncbi:hypothetical protein GCM10017668_63340 [Streptomyces tuirus]|uniref:Uncharacterized protein n=1 Tax=Streptomyces tuirus TaxID=68278 RepID=A0A7G1NPK8_9ACTN|nr:hypothetical protein GCM10017668_63340 [Streptomyces tuirus]